MTRAFVHKIGIELAKENDIVVSEFKDTKKPGKVFADYLQNSPMRTMAVPYSLRASAEATVSTPLDWSEVKKGIKPSDFNIFNVDKRKETRGKTFLKKDVNWRFNSWQKKIWKAKKQKNGTVRSI